MTTRENYLMEYRCHNCGSEYHLEVPLGTKASLALCPNCRCATAEPVVPGNAGEPRLKSPFGWGQ